jgi:hypothetical protein
MNELIGTVHELDTSILPGNIQGCWLLPPNFTLTNDGPL